MGDACQGGGGGGGGGQRKSHLWQVELYLEISPDMTHLGTCVGMLFYSETESSSSEHMADAIVLYLCTCDFACYVHVLLLSPLEIPLPTRSL